MIDSRFNLDFTDRTKTRESVVIDISYEDLDESGGVRLISINQSTEESSREGEAGSTMSGQQKLLLPDDTVANDLEEAGRWIAENTEYDGRNFFDRMFSEPESKENMKKRAGIDDSEQKESPSGKNYTAFADTESLKEVLTEYMDEEEAESIIENGIKPTVSLADEETEENNNQET